MARPLLPPLVAVRAFEAAARLGSFAGAAQELHVSHPVISHHVKNLEARLGCQLFTRTPRGVVLTAAGTRYFEKVSRGLDLIAEAGRVVAEPPRIGRLRLLVAPLLASRWLRKRLPEFLSRYPEIHVSVEPHASFRHIDPRHADAGITFGTRDMFSGSVTSLVSPSIIPVCSRGYRRLHPKLRTVKDLSTVDLLHEDDGSWWQMWFAGCGLPISVSAPITYVSADEVLDLAIDGRGVAIAPEFLVRDELAAGRLVRPIDAFVAMEEYFLLLPSGSTSLEAERFAQWLLSAIAEASRNPAASVSR